MMKRLITVLLVCSVLLTFGSSAVSAEAGNTTAVIDPAKPPVTVVISDPDGLASVFFLPAGGGGFIADFFCIGPSTESEFLFNPADFPLTVTVTDCQDPEFNTTEFLLELPSVGGSLVFLNVDESGSLPGGMTALISIVLGASTMIIAGGWYTRRRWLGRGL